MAPTMRSNAMAGINQAADAITMAARSNYDPAGEAVPVPKMPAAGSKSAVVASVARIGVEREDGTSENTTTKEIKTALRAMMQRSTNSLFYKLYPQASQDTSGPDMQKWCRTAASRMLGVDDDDDEDALPSESTMTGAVAALEFMQGPGVNPFENRSSTGSPGGALMDTPSMSSTAPVEGNGEELKRKLLDLLSEAAETTAPAQEGQTDAELRPGVQVGVVDAGASRSQPDRPLESLSVLELKHKIREAGLELPAGATEKADLVEFLKRSLATNGSDRNGSTSATRSVAPSQEEPPHKRMHFM